LTNLQMGKWANLQICPFAHLNRRVLMRNDVLAQLVAMSNNLGDPALDYVILGEGNTSARADADTFWVKASGTTLRTIDRNGFVRVSFEPILAILGASELTDEQVKQRLSEASVDPITGTSPAPDGGARPSIETVLHAICLSLDGVNFVGHTHPTAVNAILCSQRGTEAIRGRLFPEEITFCGPAPAFVPYTDPGLPLACNLQEVLARHLNDYREPPKVILLQNHGLIALGETPTEVENISAMYVKTARVLLGTYALGGPRYLSPRDVERIHTRPDEVFRRDRLSRTGKEAL
jgi:rhamnose utilization protein RhaD (predicted bifunctional aldolase and dehydrogenase)